MGKEKKKFESGASTNYVSRNRALRKLQLSLKDFRRLCILKGVYPHEPRHKKKVNKGSTELKTWYYLKDILFLAHEPIIQKFREQKAFLKRLKKAKIKRDTDALTRIRRTKPKYQLDNIVLERYPSLVDAVRDLDDSLSLCFLFSRLPKSYKIGTEMVHLCRRLTSEFLHFVIGAKALRKVFVSIKGIYYQAEIENERITWVVAHERGHTEVEDVDFSVMATFTEFYTAMLGFINFKLYQALGLHYPPKLQTESSDDPESSKESIYNLGQNLVRSSDSQPVEDDSQIIDQFPIEGTTEDDIEKAKKEQQAISRLKHIFDKCHFFLNREVPRESLTLVIRCFGGTVSWDCSVAVGAMYPESDQRITHQIIDRPTPPSNMHLSRYYIQPQWVYDSVNARKLLPVEEYFVGVVLPPHLSPFVHERPGDYIPPERVEQLAAQGIDVYNLVTEDNEAETEQPITKKRKTEQIQENEGSIEKPMTVEPGRVHKPNVQMERNLEGQEMRLREMMIAKKHRRVYQKIKKGQKKQARDVAVMRKKRKEIDTIKSNS